MRTRGRAAGPHRQPGYLRGVSGSVEKVGKEEVRGVPTTHRRATGDFDKAAPDVPEACKAHDRMLRLMGGKKVPTEVWLDEHGRVRRYKIAMSFNVPKGTVGPAPTLSLCFKHKSFAMDIKPIAKVPLSPSS